MDPYLEHPDYFPSLHDSLIFCLMEALQPRLPDPYIAKPGQRVWVEYGQRYIEPDVNAVQGGRQASGRSSVASAVLEPPRARRVVVVPMLVPDDERREPFLEVYAGRGRDKRLVTSIEVPSPSNKTTGDQGRDLYLRKQREVLGSQVHLVEIDLLRGGLHTTVASREAAIAEAGDYDYHVCVHRFDEQGKFYVYPIQLAEALPEIDVPLLPGDGDVPLDLQAVFTRCYDSGPFHREIRYDHDAIEPPLTEQQQRWVLEVLRRTAQARPE
jgi:hypothetical protein